MEEDMVKGLILFDYDGTLVDERDAIYVPTQMTKDSIKKAQEKGYFCALATGRALSYVPEGVNDLNLDGFVTCNGACVTVEGKDIFCDVFEVEELRNLIEYMDGKGLNYMLECSDHCYVKDLEESEYRHFIQNFNIPDEKFVTYTDFEELKNKVSKITLICSSAQEVKDRGSELSSKYSCSYHRNCFTFDIAKVGIHKGFGTDKIVEYYHIPKEETYAFGDGDNDIELLASVTHAVAMEKHAPQLDAVATMITGTVKEEGIYQALKKLEVI